MRNELWDLSGRAYEKVDVKIIDARTYMKQSDKHYDIITMLNTYTTQVIGYFGEPDFIHTQEAKNVLFEYIEIFYNRQRSHSFLGYNTPEGYESNSVA
jgi:transposase InsO family protein